MHEIPQLGSHEQFRTLVKGATEEAAENIQRVKTHILAQLPLSKIESSPQETFECQGISLDKESHLYDFTINIEVIPTGQEYNFLGRWERKDGSEKREIGLVCKPNLNSLRQINFRTERARETIETTIRFEKRDNFESTRFEQTRRMENGVPAISKTDISWYAIAITVETKDGVTTWESELESEEGCFSSKSEFLNFRTKSIPGLGIYADFAIKQMGSNKLVLR